jgi:hypothetical protein
MSSSANWTYQYNLGNVAPEALSTALSGIKKVADNSTAVLNTIEGIIKVVSVFISAPTDILSILIKAGSTVFISAVQSLNSLGGQFIVITPFNRMGSRTINVGTLESPWNLPALSPKEAFQELQSSFSNVNDPFRPQWTDQTQVIGYGVLVTAPDPMSLVRIAQSISNLFDMDPFAKVVKEYTKQLSSSEADSKAQGHVNDKLKFNTSDIDTIIADIQGNMKNPLGVFSSGVKPKYTSLPQLHWYGLSIANFKILNQIIERTQLLTKYLLNSTESTSKAILDLTKALIAKVEGLKQIIDLVAESLSAILVSINNTGIYTFVIPKSYGGVNYIINAINSSLSSPSTPAAKEVASILNTTNYSMLFFAGAGTGVDLDAFKKMFIDGLTSIGNIADALSLATGPITNYAILPDFSKKPVFTYGSSFVLRVISNDSTPGNPYYFTYKVTNDTSNSEVASGTSLSEYSIRDFLRRDLMAKVNSSNFTINLPQMIDSTISSYTVTVTIFDFIHQDTTYTGHFDVTSILSSSITQPVTKDSAIGVTANTRGSVMTINGATGIARQDIPITDPGSVLAGGIIPANDSKASIKVFDDRGNSVSISVINTDNIVIYNINTPNLENAYYYETFPGMLKLNFEGAISLRQVGEVQWSTIPSPDYLIFNEPADYDYQIYTPESGMSTTKIVHIIKGVSSTSKVC